MKTSPSFAPTPSHYIDTPYRPDPATDLTRAEGPMVGHFLDAAKARGMKTYLQVMAAIPPSYRVQFGGPVAADQPMMPDGRPVPDRVDRNATLASPGLRNYMDGLIRDLCAAYPQCDALKFDWPEYPPYHFLMGLADYNPHVAPFAAKIGIDFNDLQRAMQEDCPKGAIRQAILDDLPVDALIDQLEQTSDTLADHFRLRRHLVADFARFLTDSVKRHSGGRMGVLLQGFPPPWNRMSGFDPATLAGIADELAIKFYTMHWPMIGQNYVTECARLFDLPQTTLAAYFHRHFMGNPVSGDTAPPLAYPAPDVAHGISADTINARMTALGQDGVIGISHSYGPDADVCARFDALAHAAKGLLDINRYAYLSDSKLDALSSIVARHKPAHTPNQEADRNAAPFA